jgi:predicted Zn-dependent protease
MRLRLPGDSSLSNSGLVLWARIDRDDDAELVGVMAREIAHFVARHGTGRAGSYLDMTSQFPPLTTSPSGS